MNELIQIQVKDDQQLVSARELYRGLGLKVRFSLWVKQNFDSFEENDDFTTVSVNTEVKNNGGIQHRALTDYLLTLDMAKELCMLSRTQKGKEIRRYFIQAEKNWNDPVMIMNRALRISQKMITDLEDKNQALTLQLEETTKKASYLDVILGTTDRLATTQIAMDYGFSTIAFNRLLHEVGIQHQVNHQWILYKAFMGKNYTVTRVYTYKDATGQTHAKPLTCWTQKGRKLIYDILKERDYLPLIERGDIR